MITLSPERARQTAIVAQLLSAPPPSSIMEVVAHLGGLQMDPVSAVARSERLVLWSRLGPYDVEELNRALFEEQTLFEWWAFILPMEDFAIHREAMRRHANGSATTATNREHRARWIAANAKLRRHIVDRLRTEGPLRSRDFEDRAAMPWPSGGWNEGKNVGRMLELLWYRGVIATVGRDGAQRVWDLAERRYPLDRPRLSAREVARRVVERQVASKGLVRRRALATWIGGPVPGWERALEELIGTGVAAPAGVEGVRGEWVVHTPALDRPFGPRTTLLSPFDQLIWDRRRTEELFGFRFRLEIYVPQDRREFGYYVLPVLDGDRLVGRIDPMFDRRTGTLAVRAVYAEPDGPAEAGARVAAAIRELGEWLGARAITFGRRLSARWRAALRAAG